MGKALLGDACALDELGMTTPTSSLSAAAAAGAVGGAEEPSSSSSLPLVFRVKKTIF